MWNFILKTLKMVPFWTGFLSLSSSCFMVVSLKEGVVTPALRVVNKLIQIFKSPSRKNIFIPFSVLFYSFNYVLFGIKFGHKVASQLLHIRQIQTCWICKQFVDKYPYFEKRYYEALTIPTSAECNKKINIENIQFWFQPVKIMLLSALL